MKRIKAAFVYSHFALLAYYYRCPRQLSNFLVWMVFELLKG